jgi:signal transduction histidine kinase
MSLAAPQDYKGHHSGSLYGSFAFGSVILSCFAGFLYTHNITGSEWMVVLTFFLGAVYTVLGVLGGHCTEGKGPLAHFLYFAGQCALLTALIFCSPVRGFFGIIVLPVMSQAVFDLRTRNAVLVGIYLFAMSISVFVIAYGWQAGREAAISYLTAFAFTIVFTIITKRALDYQKREEKLRHEIEAAHEKLKAQAAQMEELATTRERNRVAREIHDGVGHYLTVIKTQLDAAAALFPTQPDRAREAVTKAARLSGEALDDVRRSVGALRTDAARPALPQALKDLADHGAPVPTVVIEGAPRPLPSAVEHALFRAAQEGLTNIRKHARASSALVVLDFRAAQQVRLELSDNGVGADTGARGDPAGFGLTGLRERIELLGGRVESGNRAAGGFALTIEVPA